MHRKLFYLFNFGMLAVFVAALVIDHNREWRTYQQEYFRRSAHALEAQAAQTKDPAQAEKLLDEAKAQLAQPIIIRQIIVRDLGRYDRCVTCHVGMDDFTNPTLKTPFKENPYKGHPGVDEMVKDHPELAGLVKNHPFQRFGCTVCHGGQGLALTVDAAHGQVENWEKPLLHGNLIQANCAKCHGDFQTLRGAEAVAKGRKLAEDHGCFGCHAVNGVGGVVSVDWAKDVADKPLERIALYNFSLAKGPDGKPIPREDWKLPEWIMAHVTQAPMDFLPNDPFAHLNKEPISPSGMPDFTEQSALTGKRELSVEDAEDLTAYILSLTQEENIPHKYYVSAPPKPEPKFASAREHGHYVFHKYGCAGCHGVEASKGRRNFNALGPGQTPYSDALDEKTLFTEMAKGREPTLPDVLGTYTREELKAKIQNGVPSSAINKYNPNGPTPPLYMPTWREKIKGQELDDLVTFLLSIAKKKDVGF